MNWIEQGGRIDERGRPIAIPGARISGYCKCCVDCAECKIMQRELQKHEVGEQHWLCPECAMEYARWAKSQRLGRVIQGHYQEGFCTNPSCWMVVLEGRPKYSVFLQLALGKLPAGRR